MQNIRKGRDYAITDRINLVFAPDEQLDGVLKEFGGYIATQVLAESISTAAEKTAEGTDGLEHLDIDGMNVDVVITKA